MHELEIHAFATRADDDTLAVEFYDWGVVGAVSMDQSECEASPIRVGVDGTDLGPAHVWTPPGPEFFLPYVGWVGGGDTWTCDTVGFYIDARELAFAPVLWFGTEDERFEFEIEGLGGSLDWSGGTNLVLQGQQWSRLEHLGDDGDRITWKAFDVFADIRLDAVEIHPYDDPKAVFRIPSPGVMEVQVSEGPDPDLQLDCTGGCTGNLIIQSESNPAFSCRGFRKCEVEADTRTKIRMTWTSDG